jgi:hypothetical protein
MIAIDQQVKDVQFISQMAEEGYLGTRKLPTGEWAAIRRFIYTTGLCVGLNEFSFRTRFCYETPFEALEALQEWDGNGDPPGPWIKEKGEVERNNPRTFKGIQVVTETGHVVHDPPASQTTFREYRGTCDKSTWGEGPWQTEPDKVQWRDAATGFPCLITRNAYGGNLCGYVGVPEQHPYHGVSHQQAEGLQAHGGVNYAAPCMQNADETRDVCHVPEPGEGEVWWFGFDCSHAWDLQPARAARSGALGIPSFPDETYKNLEYVRKECAELAAQLKAIKLPEGVRP